MCALWQLLVPHQISLNVRSDLLHVSCAMETLSTLKFAQRAKFIQNNVMNFLTSNCFCNCHLESDIFRRDLFSYFAIAISMKAHLYKGTQQSTMRRNANSEVTDLQVQAIINEDASGEMTALRREIQRLKARILSS
jgi:hypothetical protein